MSSGVYAIVNKTNGKMYIGSSVSIASRLREHERQLLANSHINGYLQNAFNKYGESNFEWIVLEEVQDKQQLIPREQYWIDHYVSYQDEFGYNICKVASKVTGLMFTEQHRHRMSEALMGHKVTDETRNKISNTMKGWQFSDDTKRKIGDKHRGKVVSIETRQKMSIAKKGKPGKPISEETKQKIRQAKLLRDRGIIRTPVVLAGGVCYVRLGKDCNYW